MNYYIFTNGIVTGVVDKTISGAIRSNVSKENARLLYGKVVNGNDYTDFFIDPGGKKHVEKHDNKWQKLSCNFIDELIHDRKWRVKSAADNATENTKKQNSRVQKEADTISLSAIPEILSYIASQQNAPSSLKQKSMEHKAKMAEKW